MVKYMTWITRVLAEYLNKRWKWKFMSFSTQSQSAFTYVHLRVRSFSDSNEIWYLHESSLRSWVLHEHDKCHITWFKGQGNKTFCTAGNWLLISKAWDSIWIWSGQIFDVGLSFSVMWLILAGQVLSSCCKTNAEESIAVYNGASF